LLYVPTFSLPPVLPFSEMMLRKHIQIIRLLGSVINDQLIQPEAENKQPKTIKKIYRMFTSLFFPKKLEGRTNSAPIIISVPKGRQQEGKDLGAKHLSIISHR
jgi:hypothetical protein